VVAEGEIAIYAINPDHTTGTQAAQIGRGAIGVRFLAKGETP
jgi:hypothetical protein